MKRPVRAVPQPGAAPRQFWSQRDLELLAKLYPDTSTDQLAMLLGRTVYSLYQAADKLGLEKTAEYLRRECQLQKGHQIGKATQFSKGSVPFNKGLRRPGWSPGRMGETQFKKGVRTGMAEKNWRPIGTILPDAEGYLRIKVREAVHGKEPTGFGNVKVWPLLNRHVWEQHHGPIPPKHLIKFKDGDRSNCAIENLYIVSMADNCRANGMWAVLPRELAEVMQLNGALKRKLRRQSGKEQNQRSA